MKGSAMQAGVVGYGCGGFADWSNGYDADSVDRAEHVVRTAIDAGIALFDIADIYAYGGCEEVLGQLIARDPSLRGRIVLQSKCGIKLSSPLGGPPDAAPHHTSYASIVADVEGSLRRLNTDRLDILLLHRPSPLARRDEIAQALSDLSRSGKVLEFGVSNHSRSSIELLRSWVDVPIRYNQVRIGLTHPYLISEAFDFNRVPPRRMREVYAGGDGTLEYCMAAGIAIQAWSPVRGILDRDATTGEPLNAELDAMVSEIAQAHGVTPHSIGIAWLKKHPADILPIIGSMKPENIKSLAAPAPVLSTAEWWRLFYAASQFAPVRAL